MPSSISRSGIDTAAHLRRIQAATRPGSRVRAKHQGETARIVTEGHARQIERGTGPDGGAVAPLAASTLEHRKGTGPPRNPRGGRAASMIRHFVTRWRNEGGSQVLSGEYEGLPHAVYLVNGTPRMPARPTGVDPQMRKELAEQQARLVEDIRREGGGR